MRQPGRGFTLIEMIVVLAVVGVLSAMAVPLHTVVRQRHDERELRQGLRAIRDALDAYRQASADGRIQLEATDSGYPPSLEVLVDGVPEAKSAGSRRIYFLRRLPRDPFADPALPAARTWALRSYESPPDSPAPGRDVFDVRSRSDRVALDGSLYRDW